ncbi:MAG: DUF3553 domain-containing protein [Thermohalobaculum sp.]|nr:DUF3553 domain-containing protein [Thermohalobaculum sp.]
MTNPFIEVGALVRHAGEPDWGIGQVQSIIGARITVTFEHRGKVVLSGPDIPLDLIEPDHF